jgi:hypothetical protein
MFDRITASLRKLVRASKAAGKVLPHAGKVVLSVPGWISIELEPNVSERNAAWAMYVEISTRIASQPFNMETGRLRAVLNSLYSLFDFTRHVLRDAGSDVAHGPQSLGPIAIRFLTEVIAPFTTKWNETLAAHEHMRPEGQGEMAHEREWTYFQNCVDELIELQAKVSAYKTALSELSFAESCEHEPGSRP